MESIQDMQSTKTLQEFFPAIKEKISGLPSKHLSELKKKGYRCLRLKKEDGQKLTYYWETDGQWLTELLTHNTGPCPNVVQESTLSQILMAKVPAKYYLSPMACQGILRRAAVRGKELPEVLKQALERQAASSA